MIRYEIDLELFIAKGAQFFRRTLAGGKAGELVLLLVNAQFAKQ